MHLLVFNSGSSSLKFQLFQLDSKPVSVLQGALTGFGAAARLQWSFNQQHYSRELVARDHAEAAQQVLDQLKDSKCTPLLESLIAIGHRVVHGGEHFHAPVEITDEVRATLQRVSVLAPLHNPAAMAVIDLCRTLYAVPNVAVFDTAFFHDLPTVTRHYALPQEWVQKHGIRRYGFHGLAHRCLYERLVELGSSATRVITLQLGQGCSIAALHHGKPVDISMGYTPLEGLIMATRSGDVDPGLLLHLINTGMSPQDLQQGLNQRSGLLGLSGVSGDMRELVKLETQGHADAHLAIEAFCYRIRKYLGAYMAVLNGVDAIIFGGGIGEHAATIRQRICADMQWCGVSVDAAANQRAVGSDECISTPGARPEIYTLAVNEEALIARDVQQWLGQAARN